VKRIASLFFLAATCLLPQSADSQTLQAILQDLRQLRQDLAATTVAVQRIQILLYRLQLQEAAVRNATQRHDQTLEKVKNAEQALSNSADGLKAAEAKLASLADESQRPAVEAQVREMKRRIDMWSHDASEVRVTEIAADGDLKNEQAKLADLQQRLDRLERQLQTATAPRAIP
jgi:chromosome segregation ATPase